jgi:hypothetical protein
MTVSLPRQILWARGQVVQRRRILAGVAGRAPASAVRAKAEHNLALAEAVLASLEQRQAERQAARATPRPELAAHA